MSTKRKRTNESPRTPSGSPPLILSGPHTPSGSPPPLSHKTSRKKSKFVKDGFAEVLPSFEPISLVSSSSSIVSPQLSPQTPIAPEIVTFSMPIIDKIYNCNITNKGEKYPIYSGKITLEVPDECECTPIFKSQLVDAFVVDGINIGEYIAHVYNSCYRQYYLFARIFKKLIGCKNGRCESREGTILYSFSQSSYCCGYYAAVACVAYRFFQLNNDYSELLDMDPITLDQFIADLGTNFAVHDLFRKLCNLALTYTSYFKNTYQDVTPRFSYLRNDYYDISDNIIQLCTICNREYAFHHFCTLNINIRGVAFVIISDAWLDMKGKRPLWTRFVQMNKLINVITMINSTDLTKRQLDFIRSFFFQPKLSDNFPSNIKIDFITVDYFVDDSFNFKNPDGSEMGINRLKRLLGGKKRI